MGMPGRKWSVNGAYRYGFNGKENDDDVKGEGNQQDYGMRVYDPRLGKFLSVDPLTKDYPWYTPYQFAGNKPIEAIDLDGAEEYYINQASQRRHEIQQDLAYEKYTQENAVKVYWAAKGPATPPQSQSVRTKLTPAQQQVELINYQRAHSARLAENRKPKNLAKNFGNGIKKAIKQVIEEPFKEYDAMSTSLNQGDFLGVLNHGKNVLISVAPYGGALKIGKLGKLSSLSAQEGLAYRAIKSEFVESTNKFGFYKSGVAGRLGNDGIYANTTMEGAIKEFSFHNPGLKPAVFEVTYPLSKPLIIDPPSGYFNTPLPFTQGANILSSPSLRAPGTTNLLIRDGAKVGNQIQP